MNKEHVEKEIKYIKFKPVVASVLLILFGIFLVLYPDATQALICYILAALAFIIGIFFVIDYSRKDIDEYTMGNDLFIGILAMIFGAFILIKSDLIINAIPFILGFLVLISGVNKFQTSITLLRMKMNGWPEFILAIINIVIGVVLLLVPNIAANFMIILLGVALIFSGATDIFATVILGKVLKNVLNKDNPSKKDFVDVEINSETASEPNSKTVSDEFQTSETNSEKPSDSASETNLNQ